jgi:hypothetical protein
MSKDFEQEFEGADESDTAPLGAAEPPPRESGRSSSGRSAPSIRSS